MADPLTLEQAKGNLDLFCASQGQNLTDEIIAAFVKAKKDKPADRAENLITRTLGVLQAQGIYATFLLLASRKGDEETAFSKCLVALIKDAVKQDLSTDPLITLANKGSILEDLPTLLLVKRTMEQALTYARYHAKAAGEKAKAGEGNAE